MTLLLSRPYRWPWNGVFRIDMFALVIVDSLVTTGDVVDLMVDKAIARCSRDIQRFGGKVFEVMCSDPRNHHRCKRSTVESLVLQHQPCIYPEADARLTSYGIDGLYESGLEQLLNDERRTQVAFCGRWFETSVHSTIREVNDRGMECLTVYDLCDSLEPKLTGNTISQIEMSGGIFGAVAPSGYLMQLVGESQNHSRIGMLQKGRCDYETS